MVRWIAALVVVGFLFGEVRAERPKLLARAMGNAGGSFHGNFQGRENTYWESAGQGLGVRRRARNAWLQSEGHRQNMPIFSMLRVSRGANGVGVVGRNRR